MTRPLAASYVYDLILSAERFGVNQLLPVITQNCHFERNEKSRQPETGFLLAKIARRNDITDLG